MLANTNLFWNFNRGQDFLKPKISHGTSQSLTTKRLFSIYSVRVLYCFFPFSYSCFSFISKARQKVIGSREKGFKHTFSNQESLVLTIFLQSFLVSRAYYGNETVLFSLLKQSHVTYGMCALLTKASQHLVHEMSRVNCLFQHLHVYLPSLKRMSK